MPRCPPSASGSTPTASLNLDDVKLLVQLYCEADHRCPAFEDLFFDVLEEVLLEDGQIQPAEQFYLLKMLYSDRKICEQPSGNSCGRSAASRRCAAGVRGPLRDRPRRPRPQLERRRPQTIVALPLPLGEGRGEGLVPRGPYSSS